MKIASIVLLTAVGLVSGLDSSSAEAGHRWRPRTIYGGDAFYPAPEYAPPPVYYRSLGVPEYYDPQFDDRYYEPIYKPRSKPKPAKESSTGPQPKSQATTSAARDQTTTASTSQADKAFTGMPCDKATGIVTGYGFADVKPTDCEGKVYAFNAIRAGKSYVVRLNSADGELTEVKKQP
ncbi:MAG: hypothetical protein HY245_12285 [Rhizobiales bacterium]|nr:hypothetical protein [Hyphomicrobiales bacterium]MBI3674167.1 hypothetical protein [Hyphomicrobiales bacterium]